MYIDCRKEFWVLKAALLVDITLPIKGRCYFMAKPNTIRTGTPYKVLILFSVDGHSKSKAEGPATVYQWELQRTASMWHQAFRFC